MKCISVLNFMFVCVLSGHILFSSYGISIKAGTAEIQNEDEIFKKLSKIRILSLIMVKYARLWL